METLKLSGRMKEIHLPSNFSLQEAMKLVAMPEQLLPFVEHLQAENEELKHEIAMDDCRSEGLAEQLEFCRELLRHFKEEAANLPRNSFAKEFLFQLEASYIEL